MEKNGGMKDGSKEEGVEKARGMGRGRRVIEREERVKYERRREVEE